MKIIVIANGFQPDYVINLSNELVNHVDGLDLIGSNIYETNKLNPRIKYRNLRGSHDEKVSGYFKFIRIIKYYYNLIIYISRSDTKLIHILWLRFSLIDGIILTMLFKLMGKTCVYTVHDVLPHDRSNLLNKLLFKGVYKLQNKLIAHTAYIKSRLIKEFSIKSGKIAIIKHGVYNINETPEITTHTARKELGLNDSDFVMLFYGAIARYKGLDLLFDTFNMLENDMPNTIKLLIAGKVRPDYKEEFDDLINGMSSPNIRYFSGYQDDIMTEKFFKSANLTVLPYSEASQSGVLFLSYAFGVPVIAPDIGGFPDDIIAYKTGLLFAKGDKKSLYNSISDYLNKFINNTDFSKEFIKENAFQNYSWKNSCKKLVNFYNSKP